MRDPVIQTVDRVINQVFGQTPEEELEITTRLLRKVLANAQEGNQSS